MKSDSTPRREIEKNSHVKMNKTYRKFTNVSGRFTKHILWDQGTDYSLNPYEKTLFKEMRRTTLDHICINWCDYYNFIIKNKK